jgi:hypothetical protein
MEGRWYGNNPAKYGDNEWIIIDLQESMYVTMVRIYNKLSSGKENLNNFDIRVGNQGSSSSYNDGYGTIHVANLASNPACATNQP